MMSGNSLTDYKKMIEIAREFVIWVLLIYLGYLAIYYNINLNYLQQMDSCRICQYQTQKHYKPVWEINQSYNFTDIKDLIK